MGPDEGAGSIVAERIIIGNAETNFDELGGGPMGDPSQGQGGQLQVESDQNQNNNGQQRMGPLAGFEDMTNEQRAEMRQRFEANIGSQFQQRSFNRGSSFLRVSGEIIKLDEVSLTLKLNDGGSRLVFVSETTMVSKIKQPSI